MNHSFNPCVVLSSLRKYRTKTSFCIHLVASVVALGAVTIGVSPAYASVDMFDVNFDGETTGDPPAGWTMKRTSLASFYTVEEVPGGGNKSMRLRGFGNGHYIEASRYFTPQADTFTAKWSFMEPYSGNFPKMRLMSDSTIAIDICTRDFPDGSELFYINNLGEQVAVMSLSDGTWYDVRVEIDVIGQTFDLYVNNIGIAFGASFRNPVLNINNILFGSAQGRDDTNTYIDKVTVHGDGSEVAGPPPPPPTPEHLTPDPTTSVFNPAIDLDVNYHDSVAPTSKRLITTNLGGWWKYIYASFEVPYVPEYKSAVLKLLYDSSEGSNPENYQLFLYSCENGWDASMDWSSKPDSLPADPIAVIDIPSSPGQWVEFDVSKYVIGQGTYSFRISTDAPFAIKLKSVEADLDTDRPRLEVTTQPRWMDIADVEVLQAPILARMGDQTNGSYGILDVTKPPYNADSTGAKDVTGAIRRAVTDAMYGRMHVWFPVGTYTVSDTIVCAEYYINDPNVFGNKNVQREHPNVLRGSTNGGRAKIVLAQNSGGFDDPNSPKVLFQFRARAKEQPKESFHAYTSYHQMMIGIDIDLNGSANPGAIGIAHPAAQGSHLEDITITATNAQMGIKGTPGAGGGTYNVRITGGRTGISCNEFNQASGYLSNVTLTGQTDAAIETGGNGSLVVVGSHIEGRLISNGDPSFPERGYLVVADSIIKSPPPGVAAITANRSVYLNNVYFENAAVISDINSGATTLPGNGSGWTHVREYAAAALPQDRLYVDGTNIGVQHIQVDNLSSAPTIDPTAAHVLPTRPAWDDPDGVINVKVATNPASGDGIADDFLAIQTAIDTAWNGKVLLPKGRYKISQPLRLKTNTKLFGISTQRVRIVPDTTAPAFSNPSAPRSVIETVSDPDAATMLEFVAVATPQLTEMANAVKWEVGRNSVYRNNVTKNDSSLNESALIENQRPYVEIVGEGGGKWINAYNEGVNNAPNHRHYYVEGTSQRLDMYSLNPEHSDSLVQMELVDAANVNVYGFKVEGKTAVETLVLRNCKNVKIMGYGGLAAPYEGFPLFRLQDCDDVVLGNITQRQHKGADPVLWYMIQEAHGASETLVPAIYYPTLFKRGEPLPYADDFEDNDANGWSIHNGTWAITTTTTDSIVYSSSSSAARASIGSSTWGDYAVEARIKVDSWGTNTAAGVLGRFTDGANHYFLMYDNTVGKLRIVKRKDGSNTYWLNVDMDPSTGWHTYKLEMIGNTLTAYFDGVQVGQPVTDSNYPFMNGKAGLYGSNLTTAYYDDVSITAR